MPSDTVSIVIPCYNAAELVGEAIGCALGQTHPSVEVVVIDDASTDGSWEVIAGYGERVRALRLPANGGAPRARNRGVELASGAWLLFLDADDAISADAVAAMVEAGRGAPGALVRCGWRYLVREGGAWVPRPRELRRRTASPDPLVAWLEGDWTPPGALLWPRAVYESVGPWDERLHRNADGDMALHAFARGVPVARAAGGEAFYRRHGGQRSTEGGNLSEPALRSIVAVLDRVSAILAERGRLDEYRDALGAAYGDQALYAFRAGMPELGRACLARGGAGAELRVRPATLAGRIAADLLGLERKERISALLRRWRLRPQAG